MDKNIPTSENCFFFTSKITHGCYGTLFTTTVLTFSQLVVDEEIPPDNVERFECLEKSII